MGNTHGQKGSQMNFIGDFMTPDELSADFARTGGYGNIRDLSKEGGPTLEQQHEINRVWLNQQFSMLKVGGIWAWPETRRLFKKVDRDHFREIDGP
tara:strand:+ start:116988 stop:117275 length:288 start_codon:yes stop_codon:yes gene_type:complete